MKIACYILGATLLLGTTGIASAQVKAVTPLPPAAATKICTPFAPNVFRSVTPVPGTWGLDDCRNLAKEIGATSLQVGCLFEKEPPGKTAKFVFGGISALTGPPSPANVPNPNCGW